MIYLIHINSNLINHENNKVLSCGRNAQTTNTQFRTRVTFYGNRATVLLLVKGNTPVDNLTTNYSVYCFVFDRDEYSLQKLIGDNVLAVDTYSWDTNADIITADFSGLNEWSTFDVISHRLINISVIT